MSEADLRGRLDTPGTAGCSGGAPSGRGSCFSGGADGWGAASCVKDCDFLRLKNAEYLDQQSGGGQGSL